MADRFKNKVSFYCFLNVMLFARVLYGRKSSKVSLRQPLISSLSLFPLTVASLFCGCLVDSGKRSSSEEGGAWACGAFG